MDNSTKKPEPKNETGSEPSVMFDARRRLREHFMQKRNELTAGAKGFLAFFARQKINGIIGSIEAGAMSDVEDGNFQNVDAVLAKADKRIEEETRDFRNKLELFKKKEKNQNKEPSQPQSASRWNSR